MRHATVATFAVLVATAITACGNGGSGADAAGGDAARWCSVLAEDDPTETDLDAVPVEHRDAAELVVTATRVVTALEDEVAGPGDTPAAGTARQMARGIDSLTLLDEATEASCDDDAPAHTRVADALQLAEMAGAGRSDVYCDALGQGLEPDPAVQELVPVSHRDVIAEVVDGTPVPVAGMVGIAWYAEATCGITESFGLIVPGAATSTSPTTTTAAA